MEACLVDALRCDQARAAHELCAHGNAGEHVCPVDTVAFRHGEYCGDDHRARVHRPAFERIVEVLAVRGHAVDEGGAGRVERTLVAERRAGTATVPARKRRAYVVGAPRGDAKAGDVDEELLRRLAEVARRAAGALDARGKLLGDRRLAQSSPAPMSRL